MCVSYRIFLFGAGQRYRIFSPEKFNFCNFLENADELVEILGFFSVFFFRPLKLGE